jgi:catechol 2,3-dioxygenase-like lactoylglutathione lyase family enzyme
MTVLSYITLQVGDILPAVRDWYREVVGLDVEHETAGEVAVLRGDGECRLCLQSGPPVSEPRCIDLLFRVSSVDETFNHLVEKGIAFWRGPMNGTQGQRKAILFDPVGHKVEFFQYVDVV